MSSEVDTRVTPTLHPDNIKSVDGYDETTAPYLGPVETAFSEAYLGIGVVHTARDKARSNPTWNDAQQVIQTQDLADRVFARIAKHMDGAKAALDKGIAFIEGELAAPVTAKAAVGVAAEIRTYAKGLETGERMSFVQRAIADGDETTVSSLLGAPPYLSGLTRDMQTILTRQWHERNSPALAQRLRAMSGARDLIVQRSGLVFKELEKAVGAPPHKVAALRAAKTAAEKAFVMRDA